MRSEGLPEGVITLERVEYNGKSYSVPIFDTSDPILIRPSTVNEKQVDIDSPILDTLHKPFTLSEFLIPRVPLSVGFVDEPERERFRTWGVQRTLDMPIKFPDVDEFRIPRALGQFATTIKKIIAYEYAINDQVGDYFAYLTIDQSVVSPDNLQREAPCHVDGFQGARWQPKVRGNHTYTVSDVLPTAYYVQEFDFEGFDESVYDIFWEMNAQVARTNEAHKWQPEPWEITLMDCYSVHRGVAAAMETKRTWLRLSFEERSRVFDRLGNAHNPLFDYDWKMVPRDIEQLGLIALRPESDASTRVFPWQDLEGNPLPEGAPKTKPKLSI